MPGAQPLGKGDVGRRTIQVTAGGLHRAVRRDDDRAVHLGDLLDPFANAGIVEVPLLATVALDRVEPHRAAAGEDFPRVADDEERPHRLAFPALTTDFHGKIDHDFQRVQGHADFQLAEVAAGEAVEVLVEIDHAQAVDRVGVEAAVEGHHGGARGEDVVGHALQDGLGQFFVDRIIGHVEADRLQAGLFGPGELIGGVGGDQDLGVRGHVAEPRPVGRSLDQQQDRIDPRRLGHVDREREKGLELLGQSQGLHALGPGLLAVLDGDVKVPQVGRLAAVQDVPSLAAGGLAAVLDALPCLVVAVRSRFVRRTRPPCSLSATYPECSPYGTDSCRPRQRQRRRNRRILQPARSVPRQPRAEAP